MASSALHSLSAPGLSSTELSSTDLSATADSDVPLEHYLQRIDYQGERAPTLAALNELVHRHTSTLPFENLSPFMGQDVPLAVPALTDKMLHRGRGGYCFEHNRLLANVLEQFGFDVRGLTARVYWGAAPGEAPPSTHMLLLVTLRGVPYLVDAGFGALTPTAPLRIDMALPQRSFHEPYRVQHHLGVRTLQVLLGDQWETLYRFDLREQWQADYDILSWYLSHHPASQFVTHLIAARADNGHRHILSDLRYSIRYPDGNVERQMLSGASEVLALLRNVFGITVTDSLALTARIEALRQRA